MNPQLILQPMVAMWMLTAVVWLLLFVRRLGYMNGNQISPQQLETPEAVNSLLPAEVNGPSNNLKNLFELPVIFYALCLALLAAGKVDAVFLNCAWAYFVLRVIHSLIHCSVNIVTLRFTAYLLSGLVLWYMVARFAWLVW